MANVVMETTSTLLGPFGVSAINTTVAATVNANVFAGLIVGATSVTGVTTILDGGVAGRTIGVLSAVSAADYFMIPQQLYSGQLTVSCSVAVPISFYFR